MNTSNEILYGDDAIKGLKAGFDMVANAVKVTLGPGGQNVVIDQGSMWLDPIVTKDGVTVARELKVEGGPEQVGAQMIRQAASKTNDTAGDGPQPLYSKVLTPNGFVTMGSLQVGDEICGTSGTIQSVLGIYPKGEKEIYKVIFVDGREVECCEDHLWAIKKATTGFETVMTTKEILENKTYKLNENGHYCHKFYTPKTFADFSSKEWILDPYLVGLLIGDGTLTGTGSIELALGPNDLDVINRIKLPEGLSLNWKFVEKKNCYRVKIKGKTPQGETIHNLIQKIGLLGCSSATKFIPHDYLFSDLKSREELLKGLSDTDGHINNRGLLEYSTISPQLGEDVLTLLRSLGKAASCSLLKRKPNSSYSNTSIYRVAELKGDTFGNGIHDIIPTGKYTAMQCIKVSNEDNLYFTDNFIVTHNTTTSTVLAQAILNEGLKHLAAGVNGVNIKKGIDLAAQDVVQFLERNKKTISLSDKEMVQHIATVSGNDSEVGSLVTKAYLEVGENGLVGLEETKSSESFIEIHRGMQFDRGYLSPYFVTDPKAMIMELEQPHILVFERRLSTASEMSDFLTKFQNAYPDGQLLVISSEIDGDAAATLLINKVKRGKLWTGIKAPGFGNKAKEFMQDIATLVGAKLITEESGTKLENITLDVLGMAKSVKIGSESTTIVGGYGKKELIDEYVSNLKARIENTESVAESSFMKFRLAKLDGSIAIIKLGAQTESELKEKKYRFEDAVNATKAALEFGIVPGGGTALFRAYGELDMLLTNERSKLTDDEKVGYNILKNALLTPVRVIAANAGYNGEKILSELEVKTKFTEGYDARKGVFCDMIKSGIIDPKKVTESAILNAASVAGTLLTTRALIYTPKSDKGNE